jgi:hypothetical protein
MTDETIAQPTLEEIDAAVAAAEATAQAEAEADAAAEAEAAAKAEADAAAKKGKGKKAKNQPVTILTAATRNEVTGLITMPALRTVPADEVPEGAEVLGAPGGPRESDGFVPVIDAISRALVWVDPGDVMPGTVCAVEGVHY